MTGRLAPDDVIAFVAIVLFRFPVAVPVAKTIVPDVATAVAPLIVQFWTVFEDASAMKRIVDAAAVLEFSIVSAFPPLFRPSMTTASAPFRSISAPATLPEIVRAAPEASFARFVARSIHPHLTTPDPGPGPRPAPPTIMPG